MTGKPGALAESRSEGQAENTEAIMAKVADEFVRWMGQPGALAAGIFTFSVVNGRTTEEAVSAGKYDGYINPNLNSMDFPMRSRNNKTRTVEFIDGSEFDHDPTSDEAFALAAERGLERPTYEDALDFGAEHPEEQRHAPLVWPHKPVRVDGGLYVVALYGNASERHLCLYWFGSRWPRHYRFAFIRKSV